MYTALHVSACIDNHWRQYASFAVCNYKKKWNLIQNSPVVKKCVASHYEKMQNPRWRPRNGCDGRLIAKILITTIHWCRIPVKPGKGNTYFPKLLLLKFLLLTYHHSHFLAATLDFASFFIMAFLGAAHFFLQLGCFGLDFSSFCSCILQS